MSEGRTAPLIDGRPARQGTLARLHRRGQRLMVTRAEQDEAQWVEGHLRPLAGRARTRSR